MTEETLVDALDRAIRDHRDDAFLIADGKTLSYGQMADMIGRAVTVLEMLGIGPGDRVVLLLPNEPAFVAMLFAAFKLGAVVVPAHPLYKRREIENVLIDCDARVVVAHGAAADEVAAIEGRHVVLLAAGLTSYSQGALDLEALLADARPAELPGRLVAPDSPAVILYTSGTTGAPKGAVMSHRAIAFAARAYAVDFRLTAADRQIAFLPLFHVMGLVIILSSTITAGGSVVLVTRFVAESGLADVRTHAVTVLTGVTTMHAALVAVAERDGGSFPALRLAGAGGAVFPPELAERIARVYECDIMQAYGLSESASCATISRHGKTFEPGECGWPVPGVELIIVDPDGHACPSDAVGEILIRGPNITSGYHGRPDATAALFAPGGWLRTGDLGRIDQQGRLFFVDRVKEMIIRAGLNVYPSEIESVIREHPCVRHVAVIGVRDSRVGEEICALVVARADDKIDLPELKEWVKSRVAPYKYPRHFVQMPALPMTATGKVLKRAIDPSVIDRLSQMISQTRAPEASA